VREAIAALEAALGSLESARDELPPDLRAELEKIVEEARTVLASVRARGAGEAT
jgi:hypothetical protein